MEALSLLALLLGLSAGLVAFMSIYWRIRSTRTAEKPNKEAAPVVEQPEPEEKVPVPPDHISLGKLPVTGEHLFGREAELSRLTEAWDDPGTHVISLVAWGGVGKSALVNHWHGLMAKDAYRGATSVYAMSFFSQGSREAVTSADVIVDAALRWFGDEDPTQG
ncbi:MAG: hypothetical protein IIA00_11090, partial [Proteobacteria bacterium]|nr:hypothetical protein [Pseudomonadota bacterium]